MTYTFRARIRQIILCRKFAQNIAEFKKWGKVLKKMSLAYLRC